MRIRALLFIPVLATAMLGIGVSGASAATLFTSVAHTTEVTVGATTDATSSGPVIFTTTANQAFIVCTHSSLSLRVNRNSGGTVGIAVTSGTVSPSCIGALGNTSITATPAWQLTLHGNGTASGTNTVFGGSVNNVQFDTQNAGLFTGNLTTGVTAVQPTAGGGPICVVAASAGTVVGGGGTLPLKLDARYCLTGGAAGWHMTN